jgi:hypothetical protein
LIKKPGMVIELIIFELKNYFRLFNPVLDNEKKITLSEIKAVSFRPIAFFQNFKNIKIIFI